MKSKIVLFLFCLIIWLGLNWPVNSQWLVAGVLVSGFVAMITGDIFMHRPHIIVHIKRYLWLFVYLIVLLIEGIRANIDLAYRVLHPDLPINPGIVKIKTEIKTEVGLTLLANSITFSTGACAVDIDQQKGYIYVHCLDVESQNIKAATELIAARFETILKKVFE
ncbi:MAG: Na+/H+ antiporter subunit E [Candidatus Omnitrophica bacterium]|nr:Na+/H+ antiporter subunit E [Candidatus Omnitrophota bacterium]